MSSAHASLNADSFVRFEIEQNHFVSYTPVGDFIPQDDQRNPVQGSEGKEGFIRKDHGVMPSEEELNKLQETPGFITRAKSFAGTSGKVLWNGAYHLGSWGVDYALSYQVADFVGGRVADTGLAAGAVAANFLLPGLGTPFAVLRGMNMVVDYVPAFRAQRSFALGMLFSPVVTYARQKATDALFSGGQAIGQSGASAARTAWGALSSWWSSSASSEEEPTSEPEMSGTENGADIPA